MTGYEMAIEKLSEKMGVTQEEAKAALEASNWDILDAAILLDRKAGKETGSEYSTREEPPVSGREVKEDKPLVEFLRKMCKCACDLVRLGNRSRFEVIRRGEQLIEIPVTAAVLLLLFGQFFAAALLIVGLLFGCKYRINGADFIKKGADTVFEKVSRAAEKADADEKQDHA